MKDLIPAVSVIVLTYNHKDYIKQCLENILNQKTSYFFEILIGDDASTDGTSKIVEEYAQCHPDIVRAFIRAENMGPTRNLYDLYERARGKYIASCEGDDFWTDVEKIQIQINYLESHPECMGVTHACKIVDEKGNPSPMQILPWICERSVFRLKDFKGLNLPGQPATLVHRNFFLDSTHDYSIIYRANPVVADRTIILILALQGEIHRLERRMSCYRRVEQNDSMNATNLLFLYNKNVNRMQYELTCSLERYALEEFGVRLHFFRLKAEQMVKFFLKLLLRFLRFWK